MVVSIDIEHVFEHPVEFVAKTYFSKYPNEREKFVERIDTLEHTVEKAVDYRKRIAICKNVVPRILRTLHILNVKNFLLQEESWLDFNARVLHLKSHNVTWSKYAHIWEESVFVPCPENPKWTKLVQHGEVDIKGIGRLSSVIELFAQRFLYSGANRGLKIMDDLMAEKTKQKKPISGSKINCHTER